MLAVPLALFEERTAPNREKSGSLLFANALPLRTEREASLLPQPSAEVPLLPVVHRNVCELFTLRIGSARGDGAGFAIGRHDDLTAERNLPAFLDG